MKPLLSIVVPVYNEEQALPIFHKRISAALDKIQGTSEIIYVNDGSHDTSIKLMHNLQ